MSRCETGFTFALRGQRELKAAREVLSTMGGALPALAEEHLHRAR